MVGHVSSLLKLFPSKILPIKFKGKTVPPPITTKRKYNTRLKCSIFTEYGVT